MRVGLYTTTLAGGGTTRTTLGYARNWPSDRGESMLLLRNCEGALAGEAEDLPKVVLGLPANGLKAAALTPPRLAAATRREGIDVVISPRVIRSVIAAKWIHRELRVVWRPPTPLAMVNLGLSRIGRQIWDRTFLPMMRCIDAIVVPVEAFIADFRAAGWSGPITVIPPPLAIPFPSEEEVTGRMPSGGATRVVAVGRLTRVKQFDVLLRAVSIARRSEDVVLTVYGDGVERHALETLRHELGLDDTVTFAGFCSDPCQMYRDADVLALSSDFEGFGHVVIEALAWGLPVVATRVPYGPPDILDDGLYGLLVPPRDPKALAASLLRLTPGSPEASRFSALARERARQYLPGRVTAQLAEVVCSLRRQI